MKRDIFGTVFVIITIVFLAGCLNLTTDSDISNIPESSQSEDIHHSEVEIKTIDYNSNSNKITFTFDRGSISKKLKCYILEDGEIIGSSNQISNIEQGKTVTVGNSLETGRTYGIVMMTQYDDVVYCTQGFTITSSNQVMFCDWALPSASNFELISWKQTFLEDYYNMGIQLSFRYHDDIKISILDSDGIEVKYGYASYPEYKATISLPFDEQIFNEKLKLVITEYSYFSESDNILYQEEIQLNGEVSLSITDASIEWKKFWVNGLDTNAYYINSFSFTVRNDGDIPLYSGNFYGAKELPQIKNIMTVTVEGETDEFEFEKWTTDKIGGLGLILPSETVTADYEYIHASLAKAGIVVYEEGYQNVIFEIRYFDKVATYTTSAYVG